MTAQTRLSFLWPNDYAGLQTSCGVNAMRFAALMLSLASLLAGNSPVNAEPPPAPQSSSRLDESSRGDLAFSIRKSGPWTVARRGEILPADVFLRTSAAGPCQLQMGDSPPRGVLQLGPVSRVRLDAHERKVVVTTGRVFVDSLPGWSVSAGSLQARLAADSAAEIELTAEGLFSAKALAGGIEVAGEGLETAFVKAGHGLIRKTPTAKPELVEFTLSELERLWASVEGQLQPPGMGQLVVHDFQSASAVRLNLARYLVNIELHPPLALVQIDQSFYNPYPRAQDGTYVINLPDGAAVSRFAVYSSSNQLVEGELVDRARAGNIYQSINRRQEPAILSEIGRNLFRMRVYPIGARDAKRILLDYTMPIMEQEEGWCAFELPLKSDLEPVWDFAITGAIYGPNVAGTARSSSHSAVRFFEGDDRALRFSVRERSYRPESAFRVRFQQRSVAEVMVRSFVPAPREAPGKERSAEEGSKDDMPDEVKPAEGATADAPEEKNAKDKPAEPPPEPQCEFLATISPAVLDSAATTMPAPPLPVDVLILADTSGGMTVRNHLRQVVRTIAGSLRTGDRFRLGCVDVGFRSLTKEWLVPVSADAAQALGQLDREFFLGANDFVVSLNSAAKSLPAVEQGRRRTVIYVGDGVLPEDRAEAAAAGKEIFEKECRQLAATLAQAGARFSAVLSENDPAGQRLMEKLASATGGRLFRSSAGSSADLFEWLVAGCPDPVRIVSVKAEGVADEDLFVPSAWLPGRPLYVVGRRKEAGKLKLEIAFESAGKTVSRNWELTLKDAPDDVFAGRLWVQHKIEQLRGARDQNARARAVGLSQEWTYLSPLTAFLVLENEAEYPKYGVTRRLRRRYGKSGDAVDGEPLPPEAREALSAPPRSDRPTTRAQFYRILAAARKTLDGSAPVRAVNLLDSVADSPLAARSREFQTLRDAAAAAQSRGEVLRDLGPQRGWFDRQTSVGFDNPAHDLLWQMLYGYGSAGRYEDVRLAALAKRLAPPREGITLEDFVGWVKSASGLDVWLDTATLTDEGVALDQEPSLRGIRSMSIENIMRHVLRQAQLTWVFEDDVIKVTTSSRAGEKLSTRLYPVTDLIQTTRSTDYSLLVNWDLDRKLLSNRRLNEKLNQKITVDFDDAPLEDIFDFLCEKLDDNFILDRPTLADEGVAIDQPVTMKLKDAPLRSILAQLCEPLQLEFAIENEAIVVTTAARHGEKLEVRLYSGEGVVYELPPDLVRQRQLRGAGLMNGSGMGGMLLGGGFGGGAPPPAGGGPAVPAGTAISQSSADGDAPQSAIATSDPLPPAEPDVEADESEAPTVIEQVDKFNSLSRRRAMTTAGETIDLVKQTIAPDSWEDLSGPGCMRYFPGALSFAVRQTQSIHEEVGELLDRLRALPPAFGKEAGFKLARIPQVGPDDINNWDMNSLMNLLTNIIEPDSWEDLSGPGSVQMYAPKLVLSVRQTQDVQREIGNLLTALRRARYLARQGRQWRSFGLAEGPWFTGVLGLTDILPGRKQSELPQPGADELAALAVLAKPPLGQQTWRSVPSDGRPPQTTIVRSSVARAEFEFDGRRVRVEADDAMVAYPGITFVERGPWGEAMRRIIDGRLPWLPHRTGRELSCLFKVTTEGQDDESVQLRFELPGAPAGTDLHVSVSRKNGLPTRWESRLDGKPVVRLRFEDLGGAAGRRFWKTVIAEDDSGRELERWELVKIEELTSPIPALDAGWKDFVELDLRTQERVSQPAVIRVLQAVRLRDWPAVDRALTEALAKQPDQPFLLLVKAWSLAQHAESRGEEIVQLLKRVGRLGTAELLQPLVDRSFASIDDEMVYELLLEQPRARRRVADWEILARVAARVGKPREAIADLEAAIEQAGPAGDDPARATLLVQLLLETGLNAQAVAAANTRALRPDIQPEELVSLAETLHQWGSVTEASGLMRQALASRQISGERRYRLLKRRAALESGPVRWQTLLEAIDSVPGSATHRSESVEAILGDLTDPAQGDAAARLGDDSKNKAVQAALQIRRAELFALRSNAGPAADIAWELYQSKRLPARRHAWLFTRLAAARQHARLVEFVEARLRAGEKLNPKQLEALAAAYDAAGRPDAAHRARTNVLEFQRRR